MMKILFLLLSLIFLTNTGKSQELKVVGELNYKFEDTGTYRVFGANKDYLVWFDYQAGTLFLYNLETNQVFEKKLSKGRGPSEYLQPTSIYINDNSDIYLADFPNSKLIVWSMTQKAFLDDIKLKTPPFRITGAENDIYSFNLSNPDYPIDYLSLETKESASLTLEGSFFENSKPNEVLFNRDGSLIYFDNKVVHLSKYRNALTFFSKNSKKNTMKITTERIAQKQEIGVKQTELADGSVQQSLDVNKLLLSQSFVKHPAENSLAIVFQDNRDNSIYSSKSIFNYVLADKELDIENPSMVDFNIDQIVSNSVQIFAFSKEKGKVYILE